MNVLVAIIAFSVIVGLFMIISILFDTLYSMLSELKDIRYHLVEIIRRRNDHQHPY